MSRGDDDGFEGRKREPDPEARRRTEKREARRPVLTTGSKVLLRLHVGCNRFLSDYAPLSRAVALAAAMAAI
jgi:hypothetical protein